MRVQPRKFPKKKHIYKKTFCTQTWALNIEEDKKARKKPFLGKIENMKDEKDTEREVLRIICKDND